jgi:hypothetical protein
MGAGANLAKMSSLEALSLKPVDDEMMNGTQGD